MVETGLRTYGYEVDPRLKEIFTRIRALGELAEMASYGFDISGSAGTAKETVLWLYFGYRASM